MELSDDHDACNELLNSINELVHRWGTQITSIPMGSKECKEANDTLDAFSTEHKLRTLPGDIVSKAKALEQLLNEVSQNIETLQASSDAKPHADSAPSGAPASQSRPYGQNTSFHRDVSSNEPVVLDLTYSLEDINLEQYNLADHNPFYTQAAASSRQQLNHMVLPRANRFAPHGHFGTMRPTGPSAPASSQHLLQLRELPLRPFNGNVLEWTTFRERFLRVIEAPGRTLADSEKLAYLIQYLQGEPADLVSHMAITDANFHRATATLQHRYGRPELIEIRVMQELESLKPPGKRAHELRHFVDSVYRLCSHLKAISVDSNQTTIRHLLESKLHPAVRTYALQQRMRFKEWNTQSLIRILEEKAQLDESVAAYDAQAAVTKPAKAIGWNDTACVASRTHIQEHESAPGTYAAATTGSTRCVFCSSSSHWSSDCRKVSSSEDRWAYVLKYGLCFQCLRRGHWVNDCPRKTRKCTKCQQQHHMALCRKGEPDRPQGRRRVTANLASATYNCESSSDDETASGPPSDLESEPDEQSHSYSLNASPESRYCDSGPRPHHDRVFLHECIRAPVGHVKSSKQKTVTIMFDSGSTGSFVTRRLADELGLPNKKQETLNISTFGRAEKLHLDATKTELYVKTQNGTIMLLDVHAVDHITNDMPVASFSKQALSRALNERRPTLPDDVSFHMEQPDLLIGVNYHHLFQKSKPTKLDGLSSSDRFSIVKTNIGCMLVGEGYVKPFLNRTTATPSGVLSPPAGGPDAMKPSGHCSVATAANEAAASRVSYINSSGTERIVYDEVPYIRPAERIVYDKDGNIECVILARKERPPPSGTPYREDVELRH
ncbi:Zinc knuckle family protein [Aphelenchoides avenae]|nr:Zinc knuckle family protein [Aphelenchus avenae]